MSQGDEMYSVGNMVNNYVIILYSDNIVTRLTVIIVKCIEIVIHYIV